MNWVTSRANGLLDPDLRINNLLGRPVLSLRGLNSDDLPMSRISIPSFSLCSPGSPLAIFPCPESATLLPSIVLPVWNLFSFLLSWLSSHTLPTSQDRQVSVSALDGTFLMHSSQRLCPPCMNPAVLESSSIIFFSPWDFTNLPVEVITPPATHPTLMWAHCLFSLIIQFPEPRQCLAHSRGSINLFGINKSFINFQKNK